MHAPNCYSAHAMPCTGSGVDFYLLQQIQGQLGHSVCLKRWLVCSFDWCRGSCLSAWSCISSCSFYCCWSICIVICSLLCWGWLEDRLCRRDWAQKLEHVLGDTLPFQGWLKLQMEVSKRHPHGALQRKCHKVPASMQAHVAHMVYPASIDIVQQLMQTSNT